jgi:outer membrane lipoprotein-sorting protein
LADKAFAGQTFAKIEAKSKADNSPYSKSILWIDSKDNEIYKIEAYDKTGGALLKTFLFVKFDTQKGLRTPIQTMVTNHKKGTKTLLQLNGLKVNSGLSDEVFSVKNLEQ